MNNNYNQGDIVLVPFPFTMGTSSKPRPAIVISNSHVNNTSDVLLAQITSKPREDYFTFKLDNNHLSPKLNLQSQVRCHKIFILEKKTIQKCVSSLDESELKKLIDKIKTLIEV